MKMKQNVPKRRHIQFRRRGITQKKTYNNDKLKRAVGVKAKFTLEQATKALRGSRGIAILFL